MSILPPVISQIGYPGAGDIDDCWVVSTVWAEQASRPGSFKPTVPQFRAKADRPDAPGATGGNISNVYNGARGTWPTLPITLYKSAQVEPLINAVKAGRIASVALDSSALPARLRFGFMFKHQCGLASPDGTHLLLMNPLASSGSALLAITPSELARAMLGLLTPAQSNLRFRAVLFPEPIADYTVRINALAVVRQYDLKPQPGENACITGWTDQRWLRFPSSAPCEAPANRVTCDGESSATTVRVLAGRFAGKHIRVGHGTSVVPR